MEGDFSILAGLVLYLIVMLCVGLAASRYMKSLDDFVLGGRRLGPWVAAISERASGESAWFLLGLPGAAYVAGFTEFWSVIGIAFGILASWTFIAMPLRRETEKYGALTIPDYLEARFQDQGRDLQLGEFQSNVLSPELAEIANQNRKRGLGCLSPKLQGP